jgi:uncharacterized protein
MLGRLARWLRVLGHDTHFQAYYETGSIDRLVKRENRRLLSRRKGRCEQHADAILLHHDLVGEQLVEMDNTVPIAKDRSAWFGRCLVCNAPLIRAVEEEAREHVPEHVFYENMTAISSCPSCGRYYWPGSHRKRMLRQLEEWGFGGLP